MKTNVKIKKSTITVSFRYKHRLNTKSVVPTEKLLTMLINF